MLLLWVSKNCLHENPYNVKGIIKLAGLKGKPKDIFKDSVFGTLKADDMESLPSMNSSKENK